MIVAVDPGKASGVAILYTFGKFSSFILEFDQMLDQISNFDWDTIDVLICEDYIVTQQTIQKSRQNYSLELIGALRYEARMRQVPFSLQTPSQAKSFATDEKLKKIGWYRPGAGHDNDAARHLLVYCVNNGIIKPEELI